jgi:hypothetical protein
MGGISCILPVYIGAPFIFNDISIHYKKEERLCFFLVKPAAVGLKQYKKYAMIC